MRRAQDESGRAPGRVRRHSVDARISLRRVRRGSVPAWPRASGAGVRCRRSPSCRAALREHSRSTMRARPRSTTHSRCASLRTAITRSASTSRAPRSRCAATSSLDLIARARLSTVYMPGRKLTMLPEEAIDAFTLKAGTRAARVDACDRGFARRRADRARDARRERRRRGQPAPRCVDECIRQPPCRRPPTRHGRRSSACCGSSSQHLSDARGKNDINRIDYALRRRLGRGAADGRVAIVPRERGSPLDKLVAELMIHVNNTWGRLLADHDAAGLYRVQSGGKVKMSTRPGEHQGLGLTHYLWASSPLRRYSDLVNQRQILAVVRGRGAALRRQRRRPFRRAGGLRGDVQPVRRVPGPHGALLVPALAVAGKRHRDGGARSSATTSSGSRRCRWSPEWRTCRRCRPTRRCAWRSGASTSCGDARMPIRRRVERSCCGRRHDIRIQ